MPRYIDADELYKATQKRIAEANEARMAVVDDEFLDLIDDAFTEDVAPRVEVAAEVIDDIWNFVESRNGVGYVSIGIVEIKRRLYELKEKYTDAETEPPKESKR